MKSLLKNILRTRNMFRVFLYKMSNKRAASQRSSPTASVMMLILFFVIIYYCGYRIHSSFKTNMDYLDKHSISTQKKTYDFRDTLKFLVRDSVCEIPRIWPFAPELEEVSIPTIICATELQRTKPLVSKLLDNKTDRYYLHINEQWKQLYLHQRAEITCCFREIHREESTENKDIKIKGPPCFIFKQDFIVPLDVNGIIVNCMRRGSKQLIFIDAFFFLHKRNQSHSQENDNKIGVLLLGMDSLSQINLRRSMRQTYKYLRNNKNQWHEMSGFNKLGYDAHPNLMALLTGCNLAKNQSLCYRSHEYPLDSHLFLWKQVTAVDMPTAFAEDRTDLRTLTTERVDFKQPPTDYYLRPFMSVIERQLRINASFLVPKYCLGPRFAANYVLDYALEFAERFSGRGGLGLFWVKSFCDHFMEPKVFDHEFTNYLELLESRQILENYVVILLSGNGMLRGRLNKLKSGFYEERLPLLYISLPTAWKEQHPYFVQALQGNRNRLISPLDLHETMKHVLALGAGVPPQYAHAADCPSCQSILKPIAANRSCSDAGIDWLWCSCEPFVAKWCNSYESSLVMNSLLSHMNRLLWNASLLNGTCHFLSVHTLYGIYNGQRDSNYYYVKFSTSAGNAEFEVALWYNSDTLTVSLDKNKFNRLDQAAFGCVRSKDKLLRKLCVCVRKAGGGF